jgi:nucleoid-associated protein YejK
MVNAPSNRQAQQSATLVKAAHDEESEEVMDEKRIVMVTRTALKYQNRDVRINDDVMLDGVSYRVVGYDECVDAYYLIHNSKNIIDMINQVLDEREKGRK